ncbi:MAG: hypothetical protein M3Y42_02840 [Actinomycetota bacterium]|nr:hypothetical protein [Actinomycetota bacterium]MDQ2955884.1 hypothetical protein [Actinomycetota bacterium]
MSEPDPYRTPGTVIGAVSAATVVVPFLMVYAFLFIVRGLFVQVEQPDITSSRSGEAIAGFVALAFLIFVLWGMIRLLNGNQRLVFWAGQLITAVSAAKLLFDSSSGQPEVPLVVLVAALLAIGLSVLPASSEWVRTEGGNRPPAAPVEPELSDQTEVLDRPIGQQG